MGYPGDKFVYLRETKGEKGAYITLSYVWGSPNKVSATASTNFEERKNGILVETLPKTFQDVITITRKLNVPYVWIDALCIIQDDEGDWNREASQMARIYQLSLLTVAATGAEDASKGCFLDRVPTSVEIGPLVKLPYRTKEGVVSGQFSVYEPHTTFAEEYDRFIEKSPLLKRGWVFQERALSRRMVHYTKGKMFFECRTSRFMDECQEGVGKENIKLGGFWGQDIKAKGEVTTPPKEPKPLELSILGRWYSALGIYSQLRLTKAKDKLAAIAGVAKEFQMLLSMERDQVGKPGRDGSAIHTPLYVSGLWSHDLLCGLSWYPSKPQKLWIAGNKAPSWSWASWHTPIAWPRCTTFKPECKLIVPEMQEQYGRAESMKMKSRRRVKASELSSFVAELPRGITSDTTMTFLSELEITGNIREVWRRPQAPQHMTVEERKAFSEACELKGGEIQWLQYCHAMFTAEDASKPSGFGCFEDYWLAKSAESTILGKIGAELNGRFDEDEAVAMLLSLKDGDGKDQAGPSTRAEDDLDLAIAASLGKAPPTNTKVAAKEVDLDEEFNDQLAIALLMSAEEDARNKNASKESETGEASSSAEISKQGAEADEAGKNLHQPSPSTDINGELSKDCLVANPTSAKDGENVGVGEEPESLHGSPDKPLGPAEIKAKRRAREERKRNALSEEATQLAHTNGKDPSVLDDSTNIEAPNLAAEGNHESAGISHLIPARTSSKDAKGKAKVLADPPTAINNQFAHLPAKLHCLPLYSWRASGALGYLGLSTTVYTVLFLRAAGEREGRRVFERVGVGKIVEREFFGNAKTETVILV